MTAFLAFLAFTLAVLVIVLALALDSANRRLHQQQADVMRWAQRVEDQLDRLDLSR